MSAILLGGLALGGCQSGDTSGKADFIGPDTSQLIVGYVRTCHDGGMPADGAMSLSGIGFIPGASVALSWLQASTGLSGTWASRTATPSGELDARVTLPAGSFQPGDQVQIWAQGSGPDGISAMRGDATVGGC